MMLYKKQNKKQLTTEDNMWNISIHLINASFFLILTYLIQGTQKYALTCVYATVPS
jgi:hypothetical protein